MTTTTFRGEMLKSGQIPRANDYVRAAPSAAWPEGRNGQITKVFNPDSQIHPGRVAVRWIDRNETSHRMSRLSPAQLTLVRCSGCSEENVMPVSDGAGGVDFDICPRCYRADDAGPLEAQDVSEF